MMPRASADARFPLLCAAPLAKDLTKASVAGIALPLPSAQPQRILVVGDTGCRIQGALLQDCNDPRRWPFPAVAAAAASLKPDLVIHVGDYLYRESPCPAGNVGCAGSPWGDNWTTWVADFFTPAAPLLAAAPVVLPRGNHESCDRSGPGFLRLMGPLAFDPGAPCAVHLPVYTVDLGGLTLAVMDDNTADEVTLVRQDLPGYAADIAGLGGLPAPVWFVHHRPIWAPVSGPFGLPVGGNLPMITAVGRKLIPRNVELMLSGHLHTFQAINYYNGVPPQLVAGNGGDALLVTPKNLKGAIFQGHSGVTVKDGLSVGGFGFLLLVRDGAGWTVDLFKADGTPEGTCRFTPRPARLDCPDLNAGK